MFSSSISLSDVLNSASIGESLTVASLSDIPYESPETDPMSMIHSVAKLIKAYINECKGIPIQPLDVNDLNLNATKSTVPMSLYWLLQWMIIGEKFKGNDLPEGPCPNNADKRKILMLTQDLIHCSSHAAVKLPKHVSLGITLRQLTGSKQIITLLNRMGHCSSYEEVETVDTSLASEVLAASHETVWLFHPIYHLAHFSK